MGAYWIDEAQFCIDIEYSDGSQKSFEKISLTTKDFEVFKKILSFTNPTSIDSVGYKIRMIKCAFNIVPLDIQQPEEILVPVDTIK